MAWNRREGKSSGHGWSGRAEKKKSYLETYGTYIEETERSKAAQAQAEWDAWVDREVPVVYLNGARFLAAALRLLPATLENPAELAWKALLCQVMTAFQEDDCWDLCRYTVLGMFVHDLAFFPGKALARVLVRQSGIVSAEEFDLAMDRLTAGKGEVLFQDEGILTETECGTFWREVIGTLPPCRRAGIFVECEDGYLNLDIASDDPDAAGKLEDCLVIMAPLAAQFAGDGQDRYNTRLMKCFLKHWCALRGEQEEPEEEPESLFNDPDIEQLIKLYPKLTERWSAEELADTVLSRAGLLEELYRADPREGIAAWRTLVKSTEPLTDPKAAENFLYEMEPIWLEGEEDPELLRPMLEEFQKDETLARQVFQSAFVNYFQQNILKAAVACGERGLARHLFDLLLENPLPREQWEEPFEDFLALLPPDAPEGSETGYYRYCRVEFEGIRRSYAYLTGGLPVRPGDRVLAPFGEEPREGTVRAVMTCTGAEAPWPPEKTKRVLKIIGNCS